MNYFKSIRHLLLLPIPLLEAMSAIGLPKQINCVKKDAMLC